MPIFSFLLPTPIVSYFFSGNFDLFFHNLRFSHYDIFLSASVGTTYYFMPYPETFRYRGIYLRQFCFFSRGGLLCAQKYTFSFFFLFFFFMLPKKKGKKETLRNE